MNIRTSGLSSVAGAVSGFTMWGIIASVVFSVAGMVYLKIGRKESDFFTIFTGLALLGFPYFVTKTLYIVLIGSAIMAYHYYHKNYE